MVCPHCIVFNKAYFIFQFAKTGNNEELHDELCGLLAPFTLYFSNISGVDISFKADAYDHFTGFRAHYIIEGPGEGE